MTKVELDREKRESLTFVEIQMREWFSFEGTPYIKITPDSGISLLTAERIAFMDRDDVKRIEKVKITF